MVYMIFDGERCSDQSWNDKDKRRMSRLVLIGNNLNHEEITDQWYKTREVAIRKEAREKGGLLASTFYQQGNDYQTTLV